MCCVDWRISGPCAASSKITVLSVKSQSHSTPFFCFSARINLRQRVRMTGRLNAWTESIKRLRYNRMFLLNKAFVWLCVWTVLHLWALPFHCWNVGKYSFSSVLAMTNLILPSTSWSKQPLLLVLNVFLKKEKQTDFSRNTHKIHYVKHLQWVVSSGVYWNASENESSNVKYDGAFTGSTTFCWGSAFFSIRQRGISLFKRARSLWMVPETAFLSDCRWHSASAWRLC